MLQSQKRKQVPQKTKRRLKTEIDAGFGRNADHTRHACCSMVELACVTHPDDWLCCVNSMDLITGVSVIFLTEWMQLSPGYNKLCCTWTSIDVSKVIFTVHLVSTFCVSCLYQLPSCNAHNPLVKLGDLWVEVFWAISMTIHQSELFRNYFTASLTMGRFTQKT